MPCAVGAHGCPVRLEIIGSGIDAERFARRVACALAALGWAAAVPKRADIQAALDAGATRDRVLLADGFEPMPEAAASALTSWREAARAHVRGAALVQGPRS